jgi:lipopolysaccharide transport system permease protein
MSAQQALILTFTQKELSARYAGSVMGFAWALLGPMLMLVIYSYVFGSLFKAGSIDLGANVNYMVYVGVALWPWMMFADGVARAVPTIQSNAGLVRKISFPHHTLVNASVASTFILHLVGYALVLCVLAYLHGGIKVSGIPGLALILACVYILTLGFAFLLAALQAMVRDIEQMIGPLLMMLYFLTPVLYPLAQVPASVREWISWNPLTVVVTRVRDFLLSGAAPQWGDLLLFAFSLLVLVIGYAVFKRLSPYFEDFV